MTTKLSQYLQATYDNPEYQRIIFGVLKRLHINYYHPDRADFEQEARLIIAAAMQQFEATHSEPVIGRQKVRNLYLYQHLYWRLLDQLRTQQRRNERIQLSIDQASTDPETELGLEKIFKDFSAQHHFANCELNQFFATLLPKLTIQQRRYLQMVYLGYNQTEIAQRLQISKQAVTNLRCRVIENGRRLLNDG